MTARPKSTLVFGSSRKKTNKVGKQVGTECDGKVRDMKNHKIFDNVKRKLPNVLTTQNLLNNYTIGILAIMLKKKIFKIK